MDLLQSIYIAASVFGVGITIIDILGLFGHHGHSGDTSGHGSGHDSGGHIGADHGGSGHGAISHDAGHAGGDHGTGGHDAFFDHGGHDSGHAGHAGDHGAGHDTGHHGGHEAAGHHDHGHETSVVSQDKKELRREQKVSPLLRALTFLRSLVYFAFGFGPTGLVALLSGLGALGSFLLAVPVGALFIGGGFLVRRLQTRELDSLVHDQDLVLEEATVIVPIEPGRIGKVRIELGGSFVERFAKAKRPEDAFGMDAKVQVVEATDELLIVEDQYSEQTGGER